MNFDTNFAIIHRTVHRQADRRDASDIINNLSKAIMLKSGKALIDDNI